MPSPSTERVGKFREMLKLEQGHAVLNNYDVCKLTCRLAKIRQLLPATYGTRYCVLSEYISLQPPTLALCIFYALIWLDIITLSSLPIISPLLIQGKEKGQK